MADRFDTGPVSKKEGKNSTQSMAPEEEYAGNEGDYTLIYAVAMFE